jgi:hypothetical protein
VINVEDVNAICNIISASYAIYYMALYAIRPPNLSKRAVFKYSNLAISLQVQSIPVKWAAKTKMAVVLALLIDRAQRN